MFNPIFWKKKKKKKKDIMNLPSAEFAERVVKVIKKNAVYQF